MVNKLRKTRWAGYVTHMRRLKNVYKILAVISEEKSSLGRPGCK
jgi:hypothetical protein